MRIALVSGSTSAASFVAMSNRRSIFPVQRNGFLNNWSISNSFAGKSESFRYFCGIALRTDGPEETESGVGTHEA
jgi:hypothetical protein